jgi:hypothetical protein
MPPTLNVIFGEDVSGVRIVERSFYARCHGPICATTRPGKILLCGTAQDFFADPELVLHEYFHVVRQWQTGELTRRGYLVECARRGYVANRFEIAAREFAARELQRCRTLLGC